MGFFQRRQSVVRHGIVMDQIQLQRSDEPLRRAVFETDVVVGPNVVHQGVKTIELLQRLLDGLGADPRGSDLSEEKLALRSKSAQFGEQLLARLRIVIQKDGNRPFRNARPYYRSADALSAARYQNYFSF